MAVPAWSGRMRTHPRPRRDAAPVPPANRAGEDGDHEPAGRPRLLGHDAVRVARHRLRCPRRADWGGDRQPRRGSRSGLHVRRGRLPDQLSRPGGALAPSRPGSPRRSSTPSATVTSPAPSWPRTTISTCTERPTSASPQPAVCTACTVSVPDAAVLLAADAALREAAAIWDGPANSETRSGVGRTQRSPTIPAARLGLPGPVTRS